MLLKKKCGLFQGFCIQIEDRTKGEDITTGDSTPKEPSPTMIAFRDAGIIAGFTFFSTLGATQLVFGEPLKAILSASIGTGAAFFLSLMVSFKIQKTS